MMNFNNDCNTQLTADARMLISTFIYLLPFSSPIDVNMALSIPPDYYEEHINPDQFIAFVKVKQRENFLLNIVYPCLL